MVYKSNRRSIEHQFDTSRGATMTAVTTEHRQAPPTGATTGAAARATSGSGRRGRPNAHPVRPLSAAYAASAASGARGCRLPATAGVPSAGWRLTDRGVAVVLVIGLMIMVAALTVIGLTALRVTGPDFRPDTAARVQVQ
jgi:hypothetical protein